MKRFDYRRQYSKMTLTELKESLTYLQDKYLDNIGISQSNYIYYYTRYCYVKNRIETIENKLKSKT